MTSLLHPLSALIVMGGAPLAFQAEPAWVMPASAPIIQTAQAAGTAQDVEAEPEIQAPPVETAAPAEEAPVDQATAAETDAVSATERRAILKSAADALASAKTAKGRFTQVAPDGSVTKGDFALRRPGRMRFDYDEPTPVLIVSDGTTVAMEDSELETVDRVPLASTPLGLILDDELSFETEARVTDVRRGNGEVAITLEDRSGEAEGELTLYFDRSTYDLLSWRAVDANRQTTLVALNDVKTNVKVDPRLFILEDPADDEEDER
ncbi:LolA family protein [Henriciella aquimarina]|uniref:LolA family protein n=1 Tax=Henriciella aquimarina TaxID=545261 RepID=UPI0009FEBEFB|nr:outer membrane lipoprotein carrier protein LolA [Henriciella aquimarina]